MENVIIDLAHSLQENGFEATLTVLGKQGDAADKARQQGLRLQSFDSNITPQDYVQWLQRNQVTLVNAHYSIFAARHCFDAGIPFIKTIHNSYVWLSPELITDYRQADPYISTYICVSETVAHYADIVLGLNASKMQVIPNGIDMDAFNAEGSPSAQNSRPAEGSPSANDSRQQNRARLRAEWGVPDTAPVFLNVASIMATKAQLPLVKAFPAVLEHHPDSRLVLLGDVLEEPYMEKLQQEVVRLGSSGQQIIFAGYHRQSVPFYYAADVFVLPSYWEGWSLSLAEAIANGLSCVISEVGSAYEFADQPQVESIKPPFGHVIDLNYANLGQYVYGPDDPEFIDSISTAMLRTAARLARCGRHRPPRDLLQRIDRHRAYSHYANLFRRLTGARSKTEPSTIGVSAS